MNEVIKDLNAKAAVIISAKPGRFIAGANINMLDTVRKRPEEVNSINLLSLLMFVFFFLPNR